MKRPARESSGGKQRGLATVEFALCAPILLLLMFTSAELGRLFFQYNALTKSVRDGTRYAITKAGVGSTRIVSITTQLRDETRNLVVTGNIAGTGAALLPNLTVNNVTVSNAGNGYVSVSASYTYQPMLGSALPSFGFGSAINLALPLNATVVMRAL